MRAIADEQLLYCLEFSDQLQDERNLEQLKQKLGLSFATGRTPLIDLLEAELHAYFAGTLHLFTTPMMPLGSPFQQTVWQALQKIPYGQTCSYAQLAAAVGKPSACRAVAQANGANSLSIIIPCHRVINSNGELGGYNGGLQKKIWLLNHEGSFFEGRPL